MTYAMILRSATCVLALAAVLMLPAYAAAPDYRTAAFEVDVTNDVVYGIAPVNPPDKGPGTVALLLDVYAPRGNDQPNKPAVVAIHGGAFVGGTKGDLSGMCAELAKRGYVCFSIEYRLLGVNPPEGRDAGIADAQKAVQWIREHAADYGIDRTRIAALGHSAGGYIATGLDVVDTALCDEGKGNNDPFHSSDFSFRVQAAVNLSAGIQRGDNFDPMDGPMMIVHGTSDPVVPLDSAKALRDLCQQYAIPYRYVPLEGIGHDPWNATVDGRSLGDMVSDFLASCLVDSQVVVTISTKGDGVVQPEGIRKDFPRGCMASCRAVPSVTYGFAGWTGDYLGKEAKAVFRVEDPMQLTAVFEPLPASLQYHLDVSGTEHGSATLSPPGGDYAPGTEVTVTAQPAPGYLFAYWTGDIRDQTPAAKVLMDRDRHIIPGFVVDPAAKRFALDLNQQGEGQVRVSPESEGQDYVIGTQVRIQARPAPGWTFAEWQGDLAGKPARTTVSMDGAKVATAVFQQTIRIAPTRFELPQSGASQRVAFHFTSHAEDKSFGYTLDWVRPWATVTRVDDADELVIAGAANMTPYRRQCRLGFFDVDTEPIDVIGTQPGKTYEAKKNEPGMAVYTGLPGEWGTVVWSKPSIPQDDLILESNQDGSFALGCYQGAESGYLSLNGTDPLTIPDGDTGYDIRAAWELPENPVQFVNPTSPSDARPSYFYIGVDSGGVEFTKLRFGIEWKDIGNGPEWVLRGQRHIKDISAVGVNAGKPPRHIEVHVWRDPTGDQVLAPGKAAIFGQYRLDNGPWQDYVSDWNTNYIPIEGLAYDLGDDMVTFKARGLSTQILHGLRVVGKRVPGVNLGLDYDGDGEPNEVDPLPANPNYNSASDLTDSDGNLLIDSWEIKYFGAIGQDPWADANGDGVTNYGEMLRGTPPVAQTP